LPAFNDLLKLSTGTLTLLFTLLAVATMSAVLAGVFGFFAFAARADARIKTLEGISKETWLIVLEPELEQTPVDQRAALSNGFKDGERDAERCKGGRVR
jgi:uncharacterized BrkB/YihY/UPF0761 family membrane protein